MPSSRRKRCPARESRPSSSGADFRPLPRSSRRGIARCCRAVTNCRPASTPGGASTRDKAFDVASHTAFLRDIGYLVDEPAGHHHRHRQCRPGNRHGRRPAAGGSRQQCALRTQRRECPLGQPVRRAVRHRRHPARGCRHPGLRRRARRPRHRLWPRLPRRDRATGQRQPCQCHALRHRVRHARRLSERRFGGGPRRSVALCGLAGNACAADRGPAAQPRAARGDLHRPQPSHRQHRSGGHCRSGGRGRHHHHPGLRGFGLRGGCRRQGGRVPQLAGPDEWPARGQLRQGRRHARAPSQRRSPLHRPEGP